VCLLLVGCSYAVQQHHDRLETATALFYTEGVTAATVAAQGTPAPTVTSTQTATNTPSPTPTPSIIEVTPRPRTPYPTTINQPLPSNSYYRAWFRLNIRNAPGGDIVGMLPCCTRFAVYTMISALDDTLTYWLLWLCLDEGCHRVVIYRDNTGDYGEFWVEIE
jgi:hypothetical protein